MARIPMVVPGELTEQQQAVYDRIVAGPRRMVVGPLRVILHSPELADRWQTLGEYLRYRTALPPQLSELAILAVGRYWNSQVEWFIHSGIALKAGVPAEVIESIRRAEAPVLQRDDEAAIYDFASELLQGGQVSDKTYALARRQLGTLAVIELTGLVGYYSMVAMMLNAHHVPIPESGGSLLELDPALTSPTPLPAARRPD